MKIDDLNVVLVATAVLLLAAVGASKLSSRLGVPALLLFLGIGMLAGSEGVGGVEFADYEIAQAVGVVALAFILFSGGFDTVWSSARSQLSSGLLLATVGVVVTAGITGLASSRVLGVSLGTGLLLGAIVSSTDAAAVFAVMRSRGVGLKGNLRPLLELESGSNDPMAVFLTVACIALLVEEDTSWWELIPIFVLQLTVGAAVGVAFGLGAAWIVNRIRLDQDGLYPVLLIAVVLVVYGTAALLEGSGFLAVYVAGIVMGNRPLVHRRSLERFGDGLAWLMQIAMFLVLGLLVFPSGIVDSMLQALVIAAVLIFIARPLAVGLVLGPMGRSWPEVAMVSWVGLRGAVPIILATFPLVRGVEHADLIFNVVFVVVLTSVAIQGTTIPVVARWLRIEEPPTARSRPVDELTDTIGGPLEVREVTVSTGSPYVGQQIVDLGLPSEALIVLVSRNREHVVPQGTTTIAAGDRLMVLCDDDVLAQIHAGASGDARSG